MFTNQGRIYVKLRSWHSMRSVMQWLFVSTLMLSLLAFADRPEIPRGKGEYCVEPTGIIRRQHMEFLLHQRDRTVREGIRTEKHSLHQCVQCHVQTNSKGDFIPINAPQQFCAVCHEYASVKIDCFGCHATTPDLPQSAESFFQQTLKHLVSQEPDQQPDTLSE